MCEYVIINETTIWYFLWRKLNESKISTSLYELIKYWDLEKKDMTLWWEENGKLLIKGRIEVLYYRMLYASGEFIKSYLNLVPVLCGVVVVLKKKL